MIYPTITLWQPYASLVAIGAKPFETRGYPPPAKYIGQRIAIHAAARKPGRLLEDMIADGGLFDVQAIAEALGTDDWDALPIGAVLCTAVLAGAGEIWACDWPGLDGRQAKMPKRMGTIPGAITIDPFGDYSPGRWAWLLTDVQPLPEPVPAKGKQGWWMWEGPNAA